MFEEKFLHGHGFGGFKAIEDHWPDGLINCSSIPDQPGTYIVVCGEQFVPHFVEPGTGGSYRGRDPNVAIAALQEKWVADSRILYVGRAANLRRRIRQYLRFGRGESVSHWGGRFIWQLRNTEELLIGYVVLANGNHVSYERLLLNEYYNKHRKLPFANLTK